MSLVKHARVFCGRKRDEEKKKVEVNTDLEWVG